MRYGDDCGRMNVHVTHPISSHLISCDLISSQREATHFVLTVRLSHGKLGRTARSIAASTNGSHVDNRGIAATRVELGANTNACVCTAGAKRRVPPLY